MEPRHPETPASFPEQEPAGRSLGEMIVDESGDQMTPERAARIAALAALPHRARYELGRALRREQRARSPEQTTAVSSAEAKRARRRARNLRADAP